MTFENFYIDNKESGYKIHFSGEMFSNFPGKFDEFKLHNNGAFFESDNLDKKVCNLNDHPNINWISNDILDKGCFKFNPFDNILDLSNPNINLVNEINKFACISIDIEYELSK